VRAVAATMLAVRQERRGGAEALALDECPQPQPRPGEVAVRVSLAAVNFADERSCRTGLNHFTGRVEPLPAVPGGEVTGIRCDTGERVAALCRTGGYAQYVTVPEHLVFPLGVFVPGLTAALLLRAAENTGPISTAALLGATGAVGRLLLSLLAARGVHTRIAATRDDAGRDAAQAGGATHVVDLDPATMAELLQAAAGGALDVVFDAVGGPATQSAADALGPFGRLLCYGSASGEPSAVSTRSLILKSRSVIGFWLMDHLADAAWAHAEFATLRDMMIRGSVTIPPATTLPLHDMHRAFRTVRERGRQGRVLLDPWLPLPNRSAS
jgi:NADPH2:quinone reductase